MITTYLFDLDDTIIDTKIYAELYEPALKRLENELGLSGSALDEKAKSLGLEKNKFGRWDTGDLFRELGLLNVYYEELEKCIQVITNLHDSVEKVFKELKSKGKRIGIVSNSMRRTIEAYVHKYELTSYLDFIFSRDEAGCKKRDIKYWKALVEQEDLEPAECLMIGDDLEQDIKQPGVLGFNTHHLANPEDLGDILKTI